MKNFRIEAIIIAIGLLLAGIFIYFGFDHLSTRDRSVEVRGFSERTVPANKVMWPIKFKMAGNNLNELYNQAKRSMFLIQKFLKQNGITNKEISISSPTVQDNWADGYINTKDVKHYSISQVATVTSMRVNKVRPLMSQMQELLQMGVPVSNEYSNVINYDYTLLDSIKPAMVAEATRSARNAAEKFAKDSDSHIGKIKHASQGFFSVDNRDENTPYIKKIRVVTSIEYYLKN